MSSWKFRAVRRGALRSARPYKPGFDHARAVEIMGQGDERLHPEVHFDPVLLALFAAHHGRFAEIWDGFQEAAGA